jgi:O-antigen/teichoic acid export membrane protein
LAAPARQVWSRERASLADLVGRLQQADDLNAMRAEFLPLSQEIGVLAKAAVGPVVQVLNMLGHQMATARVLAFTLAINIALNALLIPVLGLMGAAVATSISVLVESVLLFGQARRRAGLHVFVWRRPDR